MAERHDFNEVFFEDVRVPASNLRRRGEPRLVRRHDDCSTSNAPASATTGSMQHTLEKLAARLRRIARSKREVPLEARGIRHREQVGTLPWLPHRPYAVDRARAELRGFRDQDFPVRTGPEIYSFGVNMLGLAGQLVPEEGRAPLGGDLPSRTCSRSHRQSSADRMRSSGTSSRLVASGCPAARAVSATSGEAANQGSPPLFVSVTAPYGSAPVQYGRARPSAVR